MFQNLANYLLGSVTSSTTSNQTAGVENPNSRVTAIERDEDDDWVLIETRDRDSEGNSDAGSSSCFDDDCDDCLDELPPLRPVTRTSSTASLPYTSNMEESWFITPPPCFTSAGPIHMETSPLENLLIEHPSMSVYQHTHRRLVALPAAASDAELEVEEVEFEDGEQIAVVQRRAVVPRCNRLQLLLQQQEKQKMKGKQAQKVHMKKACQAIKRSCLDRNNKAREVNSSRNRRQRRGERSQGAQRSHANNNRKC